MMVGNTGPPTARTLVLLVSAVGGVVPMTKMVNGLHVHFNFTNRRLHLATTIVFIAKYFVYALKKRLDINYVPLVFFFSHIFLYISVM